MSRQAPVGLVIKQLDAALTAYTDAALARHDVTRLDWQTLNVVRDGPAKSFGDVLGTMSVFVDRDELQAIVDALVERGLVSEDGGLLSLTAHGSASFEAIARTQGEVRATVMRGVSPQEYSALIGTLQRMLANLE